jgi:hypothetical protein
MSRSDDAHDHSHPAGGHGHSHGEPYVWQPRSRPRRTGVRLVVAGALLVLVGLILRWVAASK